LCRHCAVSARSDGIDMPMYTFREVMRRLREVPSLKKVCLSGGEPTLHPQFWQYVELALENANGAVQISTNGTVTDSALRLAKLAKDGVLEARLSHTKYHRREMVSQDVVNAFSPQSHDLRLLTEGIFSKTGRAALYGIGVDMCFWDFGFVINPRGDVFNCGCMKDRVGSVFGWSNVLLESPKPCAYFPKTEAAAEKLVQQMLAGIKAGKTVAEVKPW